MISCIFGLYHIIIRYLQSMVYHISYTTYLYVNYCFHLIYHYSFAADEGIVVADSQVRNQVCLTYSK